MSLVRTLSDVMPSYTPEETRRLMFAWPSIKPTEKVVVECYSDEGDYIGTRDVLYFYSQEDGKLYVEDHGGHKTDCKEAIQHYISGVINEWVWL